MNKNKDFIVRNEKLKADIKMKEITVEQLEEEVNRLNNEIEAKKGFNRDQIDKIIQDAEYERSKKEEEKQSQINKYPFLQI